MLGEERMKRKDNAETQRTRSYAERPREMCTREEN